jgi:four helix bundle protein
MRRAYISVPPNIAEGSGRKNPKEFFQILNISRRSLSEPETQIEIANRLDYIKETAEMYLLIKRIRMMIINLISYLESSKRQNVKTTKHENREGDRIK